MGTLFGTDGIRGVANRYPLDCETVVRVGRAIAAFFDGSDTHPKGFLVGRDPRISGEMVVSALAAGICSLGKDVYLAGVLPTAGVARLTAEDGFDAGIMISASHNPYPDNGIKLFKSNGYKLSDDDEGRIERLIADERALQEKSTEIRHIGRIFQVQDARERYLRFLTGCLPTKRRLDGLNIIVDGSNGAASTVAPLLFQNLGAMTKSIFCEPDGVNINDGCGSQHPTELARQVLSDGADVGLAFDGDADRLIAVDEKGRVLTGDQILAICAGHMMTQGTLTHSVLVSTVMSNMGLGAALQKMGVRHIKAQVGDRYVMAEMLKNGAVLGGEDSGHLIFLNHHTTGDGLLAALHLLETMQSSGRPLSELGSAMTVFPQCLINVHVKSKPNLDSIEAVQRAIKMAEDRLGRNGRVLVRYSGTQPQCRVMVEGPTEAETQALCSEIAEIVRMELGG